MLLSPTEAEATDAQVIDRIIRQRRTSKRLADQPLPGTLAPEVVDQLIASAAWAPFHLAAHARHRARVGEASMLPWRFYVLSTASCLALRQILLARGDLSKVPNMLAAAGCLIQVTWCPHPPDEDSTDHHALSAAHQFVPSITNMEHIAATAAAVQNLLLAATARGIASYWSSGGPLRSAEIFQKLGIPADEVLLGSVFLFADANEQARVKCLPGKMRQQRGPVAAWCRWIVVSDQ